MSAVLRRGARESDPFCRSLDPTRTRQHLATHRSSSCRESVGFFRRAECIEGVMTGC